jgi:hypothetical protein
MIPETAVRKTYNMTTPLNETVFLLLKFVCVITVDNL